MRSNCLPIYLPPDVYARLESDARANERDAVQQARWIIKRALSAGALPGDEKLAEPGSPAAPEAR